MELMNRLLMWSIAAVLCIGLALALVWFVKCAVRKFGEARRSELRSQLLNIMLWLFFSGEKESDRRLGRLSWRERLFVAENMSDLKCNVCGLDPEPYRYVMHRQRLERLLLRFARWSWGYRRAYYLQLLSNMPVGAETARAVRRYLYSKNRHVRFSALCVQLAHDPANVFTLIARFPAELSYYERAELLRWLRSEGFPIDYAPLVASPNRNLRLLGVGVVWRFGIVEAEEELVKIIQQETDDEVASVALYILCSMHATVTREEVAVFIRSMKSEFRKVLLRYMARQGYSVNALRMFIPDEEKNYYASLVDSYKLNVG